jgi:predicted N-acetyltransferase YhbS
VPELQMQLATSEQRRAAFVNVFDVWSRGLPLDEHLARRTAAAVHRRAAWYVGLVDSHVVCSLAVQPLEFRLRDKVVPGIGFGSVHTLPAARGSGFAPRLIAYAEAQHQAAGARLSLLYSDIKPAYYARLGYQLCPAHRGQWLLGHEIPRTDWTLSRVSGQLAQQSLAELYLADHGTRELSIERSPEYWRHLWARRPGDEFYFLHTPQNQLAGYARVTITPTAVVLGDRALIPTIADSEQHLYTALADLARRRGCAQVEGWLPDSPAARAHFQIDQRSTEITMLKSLAGGPSLTPEAIAATDHFCEIDHF